MNLFIDDKKYPEWWGIKATHVRTPEAALAAWKLGKDSNIYMDYDLPGVKGDILLSSLIKIKRPAMVNVISVNKEGVKKIIAVCEENQIPYDVSGFDVINDRKKRKLWLPK